MADKQITELPAASGVTNDTLIPVYVPGASDPAQSMTGAQFRQFGADAAQKYVEKAESAAERAEIAKNTAVSAAETIGTAVDDANAAAVAAEASRQAIENMIVEAITLATGQSATVDKSILDGVVKLIFGLPAGAKGDTGDPGSSIQSIDRTSGTGAPGTTDTYTITLTDGSTTTFYVYNGKDGTGSGDMLASTYDPQGKAQDIFAYADAKSGKAVAFTVTLSASGWSGNAQTVSDARFLTGNYAYSVAPDSGSFAAYGESVIYADNVTTAGQMQFHCGETPTADLTVNILRMEASA